MPWSIVPPRDCSVVQRGGSRGEAPSPSCLLCPGFGLVQVSDAATDRSQQSQLQPPRRPPHAHNCPVRPTGARSRPTRPRPRTALRHTRRGSGRRPCLASWPSRLWMMYRTQRWSAMWRPAAQGGRAHDGRAAAHLAARAATDHRPCPFPHLVLIPPHAVPSAGLRARRKRQPRPNQRPKASPRRPRRNPRPRRRPTAPATRAQRRTPTAARAPPLSSRSSRPRRNWASGP